MSKIRIYLEPEKIDNLIKIEDRSIIHKIREVLRLKSGSQLYIFDGEGKEFLYKIKDAAKFCLLIEKQSLERKEPPPKKRINLGFPLLKEDKVDFILQKTTELGAGSFYPFICSRSLKPKPSLSKLQRWRKIVIEASRQSERLWLPMIHPALDFKDMLKLDFKTRLVASIKGEDLSKICTDLGKETFFIIGPEGDFTSQEEIMLKENNFTFFKLSPHILRAETAAICGIALLNLK